MYAASMHAYDPNPLVVVKGAVERLIPMCAMMQTLGGNVPLDAAKIENLAISLAADGFRVLALARGHGAAPDEASCGIITSPI